MNILERITPCAFCPVYFDEFMFDVIRDFLVKQNIYLSTREFEGF